MEFKRYMSLKRFGRAEVDGIDIGRCFIFPKIDGTNSSCWLGEDGIIYAGSRNRLLGELKEEDNAGFCKWIRAQENIKKFFNDNPKLRLYGEFLVPHSVKTYREEAWRKLYVFDVYNDETDQFLPYEEYVELLNKYSIECVHPLVIINNPSEEQLIHTMTELNTYLIEDGKGVGEGIVIKNYNYINRFGQVIWAKMVTNEFKEIHKKAMGVNEINKPTIEELIINKFFTESFIEKEYSKILLILENKGEIFNSKHIPMLLNILYAEFIQEEMVEILKQFKNPTINFKRLQGLCINKIKRTLKEVF